MPGCADREGNVHSTPVRAAVEHYDQFLLGYARFATTALDDLAATLAIDPALPMGHCARAYLHLAAGKRELLCIAQAELAFLDADAGALNAWEMGHRETLRAWLAGDTIRARHCWDEILRQFPRDFLSAKMTQFGHFYAGASAQMRDAVDTAIGHWPVATPLYGYLLGMQAFGREECGDYHSAEAVGRAAAARNRDDVWAIHAVAHCMEMQDRPDDGIAWLDETLLTAQNTALHNHLRWHKALMQIGRGDAAAALADYDAGVYGDSVEYLDICNDVALLARLEFDGVDVGPRWQRLIPRVAARCDDQLMVFCDAHYVFAAAAAGAGPVLQQLLNGLRKHSTDNTSDGAIVGAIGLTLCEAIAAHGANDHRAAAALLLAVCDDLYRIGGSNAQRDLFEQLLIDTRLRANETQAAADLLRRRIARRPNNVAARATLARLPAL